MSKIEIETITPVHIGTGKILKQGFEFVEKGGVIGIVDPEKVFQILINRFDSEKEAAEKWAKELNNGTCIDKIIGADVQINAYCSRLLRVNGNSSAELKEFIRNGIGKPYIPGSSLKGSIRTALFTYQVNRNSGVNFNEIKSTNKGRVKISADRLEGNLLGNMDKSVFRFIKVGDAYFDDKSDDSVFSAVGMAGINQTTQSFWDGNKRAQLVEVINAGVKAEMNMSIDKGINIVKNGITIVQSNVNKSWFTEIAKADNPLQILFAIINKHTKDVVSEDISKWKGAIAKNQGFKGIDKVESYISKMLEIEQACSQAAENDECILRVGFGSGWTFMTGNWASQIKSADLYKDVLRASRPYQDDRYAKYPFPKTRRVAYADQQVLGFVKLKIID